MYQVKKTPQSSEGKGSGVVLIPHARCYAGKAISLRNPSPPQETGSNAILFEF